MNDPMSAAIRWVIAAVLIAAAGFGLYQLWQRQQAPVAIEPPPAAAPPPPSVASAAPAIAHPLEGVATAPPPGEPKSADAMVRESLVALFGSASVARFLSVDDFARHLVATVDNLPREQAASRLWPVMPTPGRFTVAPAGAANAVLADANAARYEPFVRFVAQADTTQVVGLYLRLYPLLQQAYEELGYPNRYFNDRVVQTIDHLLATPEPAEPPRLVLTEVRGPHQPAQPWRHYAYADPALEARSAGQKMLLRVGPANAQALKAKLREIRRQIARSPGG